MRRKIFDQLLTWKRSPDRRPLLVSGGRQTGKTWTLRSFGNQYYKNTFYVNLESDKEISGYIRKHPEPEQILRFLESYYQQKILPGETLVILDEMQAVPEARGCLETFHLDMPDYHVAVIEQEAAWDGNVPYACGDIQHVRLFSMDFEEFLWANMEVALSKEIREHYKTMLPLTKSSHEKALYLLRLYFIIGGLPASVLEYRKEKSLLLVPDIQRKLMDIYVADMIRRAPQGEGYHICSCYNSISRQLEKENKKFMYRSVRRGGTAKLYYPSVKWLAASHNLLMCPKLTSEEAVPRADQEISNFKAYLPDIGLLTVQSGIPAHYLLAAEKGSEAVLENYLAQAFYQNGYELYYWESGNQARLNFLLNKEGKWKAVEIKASESKKTRSLSEYLSTHRPNLACKMTFQNFAQTERYRLIPLYAAFCL